MDNQAIRTQNFILLVDQLMKGGRAKKDAALDLDMSPSFLSQLYGGKKIGDDVARKIEAARGLRTGWMDVLQSRAAEPPAVVYLPSQSVTPTADNMALAVEVTRYWIDFHGLQGTVEDHIPLLALAHELVLEVRREGVPGTVLDLSKKLAARLREKEKADGDERGSGAGPGGKGGGVRGRAARDSDT